LAISSIGRVENTVRCIRGFETINRYWDKHAERNAAKILPGEFYVTREDEVIMTVLGSCVSACIWDKRLKIGGMNHFMLPEIPCDGLNFTEKLNSQSARYGNVAMEKLINELLKQGAKKCDLEVKVCGGGRIITKMSDIGLRNIEFVKDYLQIENLAIKSEDLGDVYPRKVLFYPIDGTLRIKKLRSMHNNTIISREKEYMKTMKEKPVVGDIELF